MKLKKILDSLLLKHYTNNVVDAFEEQIKLLVILFQVGPNWAFRAMLAAGGLIAAFGAFRVAVVPLLVVCLTVATT